MSKISAVVITKNEESNIERCLKSLTWVDEIVVYDSGSTDQTVEIAKKIGATVYQGPWLGFGPSKDYATQQAQFDWIISVDADEEVSENLKEEIISRLKQLDPETGYLIPRKSRYLEKWINYGGWYPDYQLRLFNKKHSHWNQESIHEKVVSKKTDKLTQDLFHYVFKDVEHQVMTNNRYSTLQSIEMHQKGKKFSWFHYFTKPYVKFVECYFLKLGFLDGWVGFVIARNAAYSVLLKWTKLKELNKRG